MKLGRLLEEDHILVHMECHTLEESIRLLCENLGDKLAGQDQASIRSRIRASMNCACRSVLQCTTMSSA